MISDIRDIKKMLKFLSLKEASKISGYHQDYLGFLLRTKKLKGKKINDKIWLVEESSFFRYLTKKQFVPLKKIISLKTAILIFLFLFSFSFFSFSFNREDIIVSKEIIFLKDQKLEMGKMEEQELMKIVSLKR